VRLSWEWADAMSFSHRHFLEHPIAIISESTLGLIPLLARFQCHSLEPSGLALPAGVCPHLVVLDGVDAALRLALLDELEHLHVEGELRGLLALLGSSESGERVAAHLRSVMLRRKPGSTRYWLRLHDPRVFMHFPRILDSLQLRDLMGPISVWWWRDPDLNRWGSIDRPAEAGQPGQGWTERQWDAVFRIELVNRVALDVVRAAPQMAAHPDLHERADVALRRAIELEALVVPEDQQAFAVDQVIHGEALFAHPEMQRCLRDVRENGATYVGGTVDLDLFALARATNPAAQAERPSGRHWSENEFKGVRDV